MNYNLDNVRDHFVHLGLSTNTYVMIILLVLICG